MNKALLSLYFCLPPHLRTIAATLRGLYLRSWRYGPDTEKIVEEAWQKDWWSADTLKSWQQDRLAFVLNRAATRVPYYREQWAARRRRGDRVSWDYLENWPLLTKDTVRQNTGAFVADDCSLRNMFHEHTSGSTGTPLDLWWSHRIVRAWYALFELRCRHWYQVSRWDRWAILGGQLVTPAVQRRPPFWVWNAALNQLYMSSYHLGQDLISYYLDALKQYRVKYVLGYTSSLYALAQEILRLQRKDLTMTVAITNAEPVFEHQRKIIAEAFNCPVRETYGMAEIVAAASECHTGRLHVWPEVGWIEVLENGRLVGDGIVGDLVCTSLLNVDMPLIRYCVGDRAALQTSEPACSCGRSLAILNPLEGRIDDTLYTTDGRRIGRLDPVFKDHLSIREAQIIQDAIDKIRIRYVPATDFSPRAARLMVERLKERMGPIEVILEEMKEIPRTKNGKLRSVICRISGTEPKHTSNIVPKNLNF